jgi:hypothetical protein
MVIAGRFAENQIEVFVIGGAPAVAPAGNRGRSAAVSAAVRREMQDYGVRVPANRESSPFERIY